ncbi:hypothetical protein [Sphingobium yanoikuyae]|uniref:hypothetical protein n=1 Tax=Sphingobium yanoikuyae TaxID=13690 RepID=UPI0035C66E78
MPILNAAQQVAQSKASVPVDPGWTPTAYLILTLIITSLLGYATIYYKAKPALDKIKNESDTSLRKDLMDRIKALETLQSETAVRHSEAIASIKTEHAEEITRVRRDMLEQHRSCEDENRSLREQITGLQRMMITWQITSGQAMPLSLTPETRRAVDKIIETLDLNDQERLSIIADALENLK